MTKKLTRKLGLLFAIVCLTQVLAYGQEPQDDQSGKADVASDTLLLRNASTSTRVNFSVRNGGGEWSNFSIDPLKTRTFTSTTEIRIVTSGNKTVDYRLEYQRRYEIYWNEEKERWDVARLVQKR